MDTIFMNSENRYSDILDYFEYILKKHGESFDDPPIEIFVSKNENRITIKIKNGHYLEL